MSTQAYASEIIAVLDGGTTRTRLRLWNGDAVIWQKAYAIGVRDVARNGGAALHGAVSKLLIEAHSFARFDTVIALGMIGSNIGLAEVPHLVAPVMYTELASRLVVRDLPSIGSVYFIPGVRTMINDVRIYSISCTDVMRGEETEVIGLRNQLSLKGPVNFFHAGSHHKLICTDDSQILSSKTSLSGELLHALTQNTILASSVTPLDKLTAVDPEYWDKGREATDAVGFGRAAFCVRLLDQLMHAPPDKATAYLLGAVAALDIALIKTEIPVILYGHLTITEPLARYLTQRGHQASVAGSDTSEAAATYGAAWLWKVRSGLPA
ncbi:2-dehydro-3-deoxygalactonokinase [Noviherbaspirillum malthae]|uniref:2-dehydro-3-deoxygalactonokinase n=1 Tax=Noviherbaspirillum malthae TaxID=1260987 RepID=UPI00188DCB5D|nr:2-dehydro-3-deoxygalactonokinase [Noviherbaspirillum malthae]